MKIFLFFISCIFSLDIFQYDVYHNLPNKKITNNFLFAFPIEGTIFEYNNLIGIYSLKQEKAKTISAGKIIDIFYEKSIQSYIISSLTKKNNIEFYIGINNILVKEGEYINKNHILGDISYNNYHYTMAFGVINTENNKYINVFEYLKILNL